MKSISEITKEYKECNINDLQDLIEQYSNDEREGIVRLIEKNKKKLVNYENELKRTEKMKYYENLYIEYDYIGGIDEVGRGPLAGPVVTCAIILPKDCDILYINDSKQLSPQKHEELYDIITEKAISIGFGISDNKVIDEINILQATYRAMRESINSLNPQPGIMLNDAVMIPGIAVKQVPIIKGDAKSITIAAASIVAKVTRDKMMEQYDKIFPGYNFTSNKGYGSAEHIEAIKKYGPCPIHRNSFIKNFI